jgi:hypothetical protein
MNGEVKFLDGTFQTSSGIFSVEDRLSANDVPPDPDSELQCAGGCFDFTITGVTDPSISVILPLNGGVPGSTPDGNPLMRVFRNGAWGNFDASGNDSVLSAPFTEGGPFGTTCPPPGDAAYVALTEGHKCLQVTIADNGPNDKDPVVGTITDPSGLAVGVTTGDSVDLDIKKFKVNKTVKLGKNQVRIDLTVINTGDIDEPAQAVVYGVQNGVLVYNHVMDVSDAPGKGQTRWNFPDYTPTMTGIIDWTATIVDGNPDADTAIATTTVK